MRTILKLGSFKSQSSSSQTWGQFNAEIDGQFQFQKCLFKKNGIGIDKFGIEVYYKVT